MDAETKIEEPEAEAAAEAEGAEAAPVSDKVMIHARFSPDGTVVEISERPADAAPQQWFNFLSDNAANHYRAYAGGRGVFTLTREQTDALKAEFGA